MADNTLLWFCSDNGAIPEGSTGGLRGRKATLYEGGLRVPCLIEWPARINRPRRIELNASTVDIYPTLLELAGAKPARQPVLDGESLVPLLDGKEMTRARPLGFWDAAIGGKSTPSDATLAQVAKQQQAGQQVTHPVAIGVEPAPLAWTHPAGVFPGHAAWLDGEWKLHRIQPKSGGDVRWELYNLSRDEQEAHNVRDEHPDRLAAMQSALHAWLTSVAGSLRGDDY